MAIAALNVDLVVVRVFDAPRELVFQTMTETAHLARWWGPKGCQIVVAQHELKPGGVFHYCMSFAPGIEMWGKFVYREISPERLVWVNGFADPQGNSIPNPMSPVWPLEVLNTTVLTAQGGQTTMTMSSAPIGASELEREAFLAGHASMQDGFGGMYDQYALYLASLKAG
ncbi:MAG: SRPBCC domain-containing protein [Pseudomonadota bacterium]